MGAWINLCLATGRAGRPLSGYGCLTGQGNGQGGREHGQKADQLPGYRKLTDPAARRHVARVWEVDPDTLPGPGRSAYELLDAMGGDIRSLLLMGSNPVVSAPRAAHVEQRLRALDFLAVCDVVLSETETLLARINGLEGAKARRANLDTLLTGQNLSAMGADALATFFANAKATLVDEASTDGSASSGFAVYAMNGITGTQTLLTDANTRLNNALSPPPGTTPPTADKIELLRKEVSDLEERIRGYASQLIVSIRGEPSLG